jgi:hypothetical protein
MTFEEWYGKPLLPGDARGSSAYQAWQAAYRAGQEDMRERAAERVGVPFNTLAAKAIRALEIKEAE